MKCPNCKTAAYLNALGRCGGCGATIDGMWKVAPVYYGKRYQPVKFTAPPPVAPEFYGQLSREADDAINAEIQRQEQAFVWAFGGKVTADPTVPPNMMYAIGFDLGASPSVATTNVWAHGNRCGVNRLVERGAGLPECECAPPPPLYDGLTAEQCLERYAGHQQGDIRHVLSCLTHCQLVAARDLWSAQLRSCVAAARKPKLTVMVQVDDD